MKLQLTALVFFITLHACKKDPQYFIGKWQITSVVTQNDTIQLADNWMHLKGDLTFVSYDGMEQKEEVGFWSYTPDDNILIIDGAGDDDDSQWTLSMNQDTLFFHATSEDLLLMAIPLE